MKMAQLGGLVGLLLFVITTIFVVVRVSLEDSDEKREPIEGGRQVQVPQDIESEPLAEESSAEILGEDVEEGAEPLNTVGLESELEVILSREDVGVDLDLLAATAWQLLQKHQGLLIAREEFRATGGDIDEVSEVGRTKAEALAQTKKVFDEGMEFGLIVLELEGEVQELNEIYREILLRLDGVDDDILSDIFAAKARSWRGLAFKSTALELVQEHFARLKEDHQIDLERITKDYEKEAEELSESG